MRAFGFDDALKDLDQLVKNTTEAKTFVIKHAEKVRDRARQYAEKQGLRKSGVGISGINVETTEEGANVGWNGRPAFHLYFHELGFHAIDNRQGKVRLKRGGKKNGRMRLYKGVKATYVGPKPHVRPANDELEQEFYEGIQKTIEKGV